MARIRTIKPEFPQSETVGRLSRDARLLFIQLWTIADDSGRARAASRMLASLLFPYDDDAPRLIEGWLGELDQGGHIRRYEVDGVHYLDIPKWLEHQKIDRPTPSRLPEYSRNLASPREVSPPDLGPRTRIKEEVRSTLAGATAPAGAPCSLASLSPLDLKAELWRRGKAFLASHAIDETQAGKLLGAWRKQAGDMAVIDALARAEAECASDVTAFIFGCLKEKPNGRSQQRPGDNDARRRAGLAAAVSARLGPDREHVPADDAG